MLLVMPVHKGDAEQARRTLELSLALKFQTDHPLVVIYPFPTTPFIGPVLEAARKAFKTVIEYKIPSEVADGWPQGPNQMFYHAVSFLEKENQIDREIGIQQMWFTEPNGRFLWWEPDAIPTHPTWLDRLETAYNLGRKPFMGTMVETIRYHFPIVNGLPDKSQSPIRSEQDGVHMVGVGVYPRAINYSAICRDGSRMEKMIEWFPSILNAEEPFDILFQNEICKNDGTGYSNFTSTPTVAHNSRSRNYRISKQIDGTYVESDMDHQYPNGTNKFLWTSDGSIGCVLAHGCKDGSLEAVVRTLNKIDLPVVESVHAPAMPDVARYQREEKSVTPVLENENADTLTPEQQTQLDRLLAIQSKSQNKGKSKPVKVKAQRKVPDVSHINADAFFATLDAEGWKAALKAHKVSPVQAGILKAMRVTAPA